MPSRLSSFKSILVALLCTLCAAPAHSQAPSEASQLSFSNLQVQANILVEHGELIKAMPLLVELIKRVEGATETGSEKIKLDFPIFLVGTGYIQLYIQNGKESELDEALTWYDKLEKDFPRSPKIKDATFKRIDVLRTLDRREDATALMIKILNGGFSFNLTYSERIKTLKDLVSTYYNSGKLDEGLPYFGQLLEEARKNEDKALAAAASFEALVNVKRYDDAMRLVPHLAKESNVRYRPRLNVTLLKASDAMVELGRINDVTILLNLIKTTDIMIEYHESKLKKVKAKLDQRIAFNSTGEETEKLEQEIKTLEANLVHLRKLPTLRNELLVRRARNYTQTARRYEAFWMFYDLKTENENDERNEFYHYAAFANARQIGKVDTVIKLGREYRQKYPTGDYYSDISAVLATELNQRKEYAEFEAIVIDFLNTQPVDPVSANLLAQWGAYKFQESAFNQVIEQCTIWLEMHSTCSFDDGLYYWKGMGELQTSVFLPAIESFDNLLTKFPTSIYAEDALLRKGVAQYYAQTFEAARDTLLLYVDKYPTSASLDQANFFLGEVELIAEDFQLALDYFKKADAITSQQDLHDSSAFKIGSIYEVLEEYDAMANHYKTYIETYGEAGRLTDAIFELGRAYEYNLEVTKMLSLYRENIEKYITTPANRGVDTLIEGYAEKYNTNKAMLDSTNALLDRLNDDLEFRTQFITDRGFLFDCFYNDQTIEQTLYNKLRNHPQFTSALIEDLSPIQELTAVYRREASMFPSETPEAFFRELLAKASGNQSQETRALMGLYRMGTELHPKQAFDEAFLANSTPRVVLYIADYERNKRRDFAVTAWNHILTEYPIDDAAIVALMRLADVSTESGNLPTALNYLENILTQFSGSPQVPAIILRQGDLLSQMNRGDEAREKYQYILKVPDWRGILHAKALFQIGESYSQEKAYDKAHGFYERTFLGYSQFNELAAKAYLKDAEALIGMNERASAKATLTEAVELLTGVASEETMSAINAKLKELAQ